MDSSAPLCTAESKVQVLRTSRGGAGEGGSTCAFDGGMFLFCAPLLFCFNYFNLPVPLQGRGGGGRCHGHLSRNVLLFGFVRAIYCTCGWSITETRCLEEGGGMYCSVCVRTARREGDFLL